MNYAVAKFYWNLYMNYQSAIKRRCFPTEYILNWPNLRFKYDTSYLINLNLLNDMNDLAGIVLHSL